MINIMKTDYQITVIHHSLELIVLLPNNNTETNLLPTKNRHISNLKD